MENKHYKQENREVPLREIINHYTRYWYWFLFGAIIALIIASIYLRYTPSLYQSRATIIIKDEKSANSPMEMAAFSQFGNFLSRFNNGQIDNELAIFNSKRIISQTVKELGLNVKYESVGTIKTTELYKYRPFEVKFQSFVNENEVAPVLFFEITSPTEYVVEDESKQIQGKFKFGEKVKLQFGEITVLPNLEDEYKFESYFNKGISVAYRSVEAVALEYQRKVNIENQNTKSNVVELSMESPVTARAEDFLDELVFQYNKDAVDDRNEIAKKTSQFIDSRLQIITKELDSVERNKELFKRTNRLTDIQAEAQIILENASEFNKKQFDVSTQLELSNTMIDYMENSSKNELLPSNIGIESKDVAEAVNNYNQLILYRNKLLQTSTSKNPVVENVNNQIEQMRSSILGSLKNSSNGLKIAMKDLNIQESVVNSKISKVPAKEKIFRGIERQQSIKEQLYLFLLQQREEASISLAATSPKAKIVDRAYSSKNPVSPKRTLIYFGALIAGLLVPFLAVYAGSILNTKITNRRDVERHFSSTPILGEIPKLKRGEAELIQYSDRSSLAESFRIMRTNLQYFFINKLEDTKKGKILFVTSTVNGEGKTFVAFNLAQTLAFTDKKVVIVGADIRNPQLNRYLPEHLRSKKGFTDYIVQEDTGISDVIIPSERNENLSVVLSGATPPNPAELLMKKRVTTFFEELSTMFDYIIIDTAPAMLVTDTILINDIADVTLYVIRSGFTDKGLLDFPQDAIDDGRLKNVAIVLNSVNLDNFGYGSKYGYAYTPNRRSYLKRIFKK